MKLVFAAILLAVVPVTAAELYTFSVLPQSGNIQGQPGATIGWGYSIQNQSNSFWLVTTGMDVGGFQHGTPDLLFDFPAIAPGATVAVPFDAGSGSGLVALTLDSSAPAGFANSGSFVLSAQWRTGDPLLGGRLQFAAADTSQPYLAAVSASAVPEPGTTRLVALPLTLLGSLALIRLSRPRTQAKAAE